MQDPHAVTSLTALEALYGEVNTNSVLKVRRDIDVPSRDFIARSPFCILSTRGADGAVHGTPRGDAPGFVRVLSGTEVALPDRRGNNRLDALRDIIADPQVALLFLIPGVGETLRVAGRASITTDPVLRAALAEQGKEPATVLRIRVEEVYFQCARALMRSGLWGATPRPAGVPTAGQFLKSATAGAFDGDSYDAQGPARLAANLY
ncbi:MULTISPECIES: MSMEG_1061 family FMN-dependent PPOX-type flavoprotein [Roseomonadaceae]|uniref:Pyridoxamine 5'-phosphate oxidase family protein n=1 Tax=Falsiroseomonas oleicola TaxID=2801474 RepID=A0ABS6H0F1_9PROT|nr:MSMEG_1061 family FMN-dependent PPOX-type flavoprotein [Roseomonas oleicola]MBU8542150.1 pyridoxamine 5'-phosphate oxidase family protein [Roseomonas oleicola]